MAPDRPRPGGVLLAPQVEACRCSLREAAVVDLAGDLYRLHVFARNDTPAGTVEAIREAPGSALRDTNRAGEIVSLEAAPATAERAIAEPARQLEGKPSAGQRDDS